MEGKSVSYISKLLTREGIPMPGGKEVWQMAVIKSILTNEKYKGDALLQKRFTADFLTKRMKPNEGEVPQYYVRSSHPAIIDPTEWDRVQNELSRRQASRKRVICGSPFSGMLICGNCGEIYGSKVWHSNDSYRKVIWQCNGKFKSDRKCRTPHLTEDEIKEAYRRALSELLADREALYDDIRAVKRELTDCSGIDAKLHAVATEQEVVAGLIRQCVEDNAAKEQSQAEYMAHYTELADRYEKLTGRQASLQNERREREIKADTLSGFLFEVGELPVLDIAFSEQRWRATVDHVTVYHDGRLVFSFKNGRDITVEM